VEPVNSSNRVTPNAYLQSNANTLHNAPDRSNKNALQLETKWASGCCGFKERVMVHTLSIAAVGKGILFKLLLASHAASTALSTAIVHRASTA
jgi:hypothetical protein